MEEFNIIEYETKIALLLIPKECKQQIFYDLLQAIFFKKPQFYSLTESETELSLFIDEKCLDELEQYKFATAKNYRFIQICEDHPGIDHVGIVAKISAILAKLEIPILYINTFNNNFILIDTTLYETAIKGIKENFSPTTDKTIVV